MQPKLVEKSFFARYLDFYAPQPLVEENAFRGRLPDRTHPPGFAESRHLLPEPFADGLEPAIACYWKVWEIAFRNLKQVHRGNGFITPYIDTAFNDCLFMWDSAFILMFARYGSRAFNFQQTLDNFYAKQHDDGFVSRELREWDGQDQFHRHDPASTGPNVLPWCEWEYFLNFGDRARLAVVFAPLLAYHRWMRLWRSWPDGSYWSCGLGCGMDNQPRLPPGYDVHLDHGFMSWIDATAQAVFSARILVAMAEVLGCGVEVDDLRDEAERLTAYVNERMWDESAAFYGDRLRDGRVNPVKTVGAYWALLAELVPQQRLRPFVAHLADPSSFNRRHRIPTLAADHPEYQADGGYWRGGVWAPTNYMVLRGLTRSGHDDVAHEIALNHLENVASVFQSTGTVWENYAPESPAPGEPAKADFVGWSGLGPVAVLLEYVFGLRPDVPNDRLVWDVRLTRAHGVRGYPYGPDGLLDLRVRPRSSALDEPQIEVRSSIALTLHLTWPGGSRIVDVRPSSRAEA